MATGAKPVRGGEWDGQGRASARHVEGLENRRLPRLQHPRQAQPEFPRLGRMSVNVVDAGGRLTGKAGRIIIVDIASARVQQVEDLKLRRPILAKLVADVAIKKRSCLRLDGAILGERTGPEIAQP